MLNLIKNDTNEVLQNRNRLPGNQIYGYQRGNMGGSDKLGDWD